MTKMLRSRWLWTLMALSASPGLIAWLLGVSLIASTALAGVMMVCVVLAVRLHVSPWCVWWLSLPEQVLSAR
ncbi:hypothetical protein [Prescottella equi]